MNGNHTPLADWQLAGRVAWLIASSRTPPATPTDVADLRRGVQRIAQKADAVARAATGLGDDLPGAEVRVVGRRTWIASNLESLSWLTDPLADRLITRSGVNRAVAVKALGMQIGVVFGYLATKVLGQYEVFLPNDATPGRLTLVGPNLLQVERQLLPSTEVDEEEFRFGVILHELAHRLQFEAVPWLRPTLRALLDEYLADAKIDPDRVRDALTGLGELVRNPKALTEPQQILELVLTPTQRDIVRRAQTLMSLLEGHGNVIMDWGAERAAGEAGVELDSSRVRTILNRRRSGSADRALRRALGLSMKAEQYRVGEEFILAVTARHGRQLFDRVWDDPGHVPTSAELDQPDAWAERMRSAG